MEYNIFMDIRRAHIYTKRENHLGLFAKLSKDLNKNIQWNINIRHHSKKWREFKNESSFKKMNVFQKWVFIRKKMNVVQKWENESSFKKNECCSKMSHH